MKHSLTKFSKFMIMAAMALSLGACSTTPSSEADLGEVYDPMEGFNRGMFAFNDAIDTIVFEPVAMGYRFIAPQPVRTGVRNFLRNLKSPTQIANQTLQGDLGGAANDVGRFVVNSTVGVLGFVDVAAMMGLPYEQEDFGQTLGVWGIGHGPYLVLPLMGPSSLRDASGLLVDGYADPLRIYLYNTNQEEWHYARIAATAISTREELLDVLDDLQKNSFDYYAAMRSAYVQRREALVHDKDPETAAAPAIPDFDSE
ncbi:MAG: VacJ family lipoprotein [Alphaproteobacteria bacterium]|nr:VacJ family lipoprotein [Alphaproteobacteria bacterium]